MRTPPGSLTLASRFCKTPLPPRKGKMYDPWLQSLSRFGSRAVGLPGSGRCPRKHLHSTSALALLTLQANQSVPVMTLSTLPQARGTVKATTADLGSNSRSHRKSSTVRRQALKPPNTTVTLRQRAPKENSLGLGPEILLATQATGRLPGQDLIPKFESAHASWNRVNTAVPKACITALRSERSARARHRTAAIKED